MSHVHNTLIRGLNNVYLRVLHVSSLVDIRDFLFFCAVWVKTVEHHHETEESVLFPSIEEFIHKLTLMEGNHQQCEAFTPGLNRLLKYAQDTAPEEYNSGTLKEITDSFASTLMKHWTDEIDTLLGLEAYDSQELVKLWLVMENVAKGAAHPNQFVSCSFTFATPTSHNGVGRKCTHFEQKKLICADKSAG